MAFSPNELRNLEKGGLTRDLAVVTGAGSGIGRAIALELTHRGVPCCLLGRTLSKLEEVARLARESSGVESFPIAIDFCELSGVAGLVQTVRSLGQRVQLLVHSAALMRLSRIEESSVEEFRTLLNVNLLAPFELTKQLLPELSASRGQVVFINSSVVNHPGTGTVQYAATKHALKGLADGLRQEVNGRGVRIISVYPGRTATPLQATLCQQEGREYRSAQLLQPEDVASTVVHALSLPHTAEVTDVMIRPAIKSQ